MSGQREATERLSELRRLVPKGTYNAAQEVSVAVGALAWLVGGFDAVLGLPFSEFDPDDERSIWEADAYNAALVSVRAALLGES